MRAKRAKKNGLFKTIYKGKPLKMVISEGLKPAKSGLLAGPDFGNMKTLFQTFGRILKIWKPFFQDSEIFSLRGGFNIISLEMYL